MSNIANETALSNIDIFCRDFYLRPAIKVGDRAIFVTPAIDLGIKTANDIIKSNNLPLSVEQSRTANGCLVVKEIKPLKCREVILTKGALEISVTKDSIVLTEAAGLSITILPTVINEIVTAYNTLK